MRHLADQIEVMKNKGFKVTHQRLVVLDYLQHSKKHPSAEMIYNDLKEKYPTMSLATIYNTLEMLMKINLVVDIGAPEERRRFDGILVEHSHFFCTKCGKIEDLTVPGIEQLFEKAKASHPGTINHCRLDFFGFCEECRAQEEQAVEQ